MSHRIRNPPLTTCRRLTAIHTPVSVCSSTWRHYSVDVYTAATTYRPVIWWTLSLSIYICISIHLNWSQLKSTCHTQCVDSEEIHRRNHPAILAMARFSSPTSKKYSEHPSRRRRKKNPHKKNTKNYIFRHLSLICAFSLRCGVFVSFLFSFFVFFLFRFFFLSLFLFPQLLQRRCSGGSTGREIPALIICRSFGVAGNFAVNEDIHIYIFMYFFSISFCLQFLHTL